MIRLGERLGKFSFDFLVKLKKKKKVCTYVVVSFLGKLTTQKTLFIIKRVFASLKNPEFKIGIIKIQEHLCITEWFKGFD